MKKKNKTVCYWSEKEQGAYWHTDCDKDFTIISDTPKENGMKFCCYCGGRLKEVNG